MKRALFLITATAFWLIMMGLLVQREFLQTTVVQSQYKVMPLDLDIREEYSAIYMGQERIGFTLNILEAKKDTPKTPYQLRHQTYLSFLFLGQQREMLIRVKAALDRQLNLEEFDARISSSDYWTQINGKVIQNNLEMIIESNEGQPVKRTAPLKGPLFFSEALRFLWTPENLKLGKKGSLETWNPLLGNFQTISFHVKEKTTLSDSGKSVEVYLVEVSSSGIETKAWVSLEGVVLREESATGLTVKKEEGWEIYDAMRKSKSKPPDLPNLFSVPSNLEIRNPAALKSLKVNIKNGAEEKIVTLQQDGMENLQTIPLPVPVEAAEFSPFLASDPWIQSEDSEIIKTAKEIVGGSTSALEASKKLLNWAHANISPVPSLSIPQARQVLSVKKGDCNEYTVLYTALARSVGIPARMMAGLVYQNGRFFYHAWTEIYLGRWIAVDPTFGQMPADLTHIPLAQGSLEEQVGLVTQLGKIKILILDTKS